MIEKNVIEQAYCFLHQKWRVYEFSGSETQKDDIEYAISSYVDSMSAELLALLSGGRSGFLKEHGSFGEDMLSALSQMDRLLNN